MKDGWEYKKLGEILKIKHGKGYKGITAIEQKYPVYGSGSDVVGYVDEFLSEADTIILGRKGTIDKPRYMDHRYWNIDTAFSLSPLAGYSAKFIYYYCLTVDWQSLDSGSAKPSLTQALVYGQTIHIPSTLAEQQSIVEYLDSSFAKIDAMKANAGKALDEAKALFQASLKSLLEHKDGWTEKTLREISVISGNYGLSVPSTAYNGIRYLRITDITEWGDLNDDKVSADLTDDVEQESLEDGDILFARTGATVGKTLLYREEFGKCLFAGYLIRYRLNKEIVLPKYIFYITHSSPYYDWVLKNQKAAAQPNISAKLYNEYLISYPSLSDQQVIVDKLDALYSKLAQLQANYDKISAECDALKQALLKQVFE